MNMQANRQRLQTKAADGNTDDPILGALNEHAQRFEKAANEAQQEIKELRERESELTNRLESFEQEFVDLKSAGGFRQRSTPPSVAADFIKSDRLQAMREGANGTGRVLLKSGGIKMLTKAVSNTGAGQAGDDAFNVVPDRWAGVGNDPRRKLSLFDVLPSLPVGTGTFEYMQLNSYVNAAAVQAREGDLKAEGAVPTTIQTAKIATIAHFVKASLQVIGDAPSLEQQIDSLLRYGCLAKLESQYINGDGTNNSINGLLNQATAFAGTASDAADIVGEAITELQANGWKPSVVVMNPQDWFTINSSKAAGSGEYLVGSPRNPSPPSLWDVSVVLSPSLAAGTALVLDASQTAMLDRQEVTVASSREDGSNFTTNMVTILAELRAGLAVFSPGAVLSVNLNPTT